MKKKILVIITVAISLTIISCNTKNEEKYKSLPKELADICIEIDKNPSDANLYLKRSQYYIGKKQLDSAFSDAFKALKLDSSDSKYYRQISDIYFMRAEFESSEDILERAIVINPKDIEALMKLAELQLYYKRYKEMDEYLNKALDIDQRNPKAFFMRGISAKEKMDTNNAIRNFQMSVDQDPNYYDAYIQLGLIFHLKHNKIALDYYNNALNVRPKSIEALYNSAMFYQETGEIQKAIDKYMMILQIDSKNKVANHNIGWINLEIKNNYEEAIKYFSASISIDLQYVEAIYNRGLSYEKLKKYDLARKDYLKAININPEFPLAKEGIERLNKARR